MSETHQFTVNGTRHQVSVPADTPLLHVLRNLLDLKGTRYGCGLEQCGCCKVLVDGEPVHSCNRATDAVAGRVVTTVEGLSEDRIGQALQRAFQDEQAGQCGYCLAGILISAKALLGGNTNPSREEIAAALDDHICRCGSHARILRAVARAAVALAGEGRS